MSSRPDQGRDPDLPALSEVLDLLTSLARRESASWNVPQDAAELAYDKLVDRVLHDDSPGQPT